MTDFVEKYINPFADYGFKKLFETAEIAKFTPDQIRSYEDSLKYYRDLKNSLDTAKEEGKIEGKIEEKIETAKKGLNKGLPLDVISEITGLSKEEIEIIILKK
jgi:predicted transposase/invertase (TIGR01784 family)